MTDSSLNVRHGKGVVTMECRSKHAIATEYRMTSVYHTMQQTSTEPVRVSIMSALSGVGRHMVREYEMRRHGEVVSNEMTRRSRELQAVLSGG